MALAAHGAALAIAAAGGLALLFVPNHMNCHKYNKQHNHCKNENGCHGIDLLFIRYF
jgi:hypothetical protein